MTDDGSGGQPRLPEMWRITHVTDAPQGHPDAVVAGQSETWWRLRDMAFDWPPSLHRDADGSVVVTMDEAARRLPPWLTIVDVADTLALLSAMTGGPIGPEIGRVAFGMTSDLPPAECHGVHSPRLGLRIRPTGDLRDTQVSDDPARWVNDLSLYIRDWLWERHDLWTAARNRLRPPAEVPWQASPWEGKTEAYALRQAFADPHFPRLPPPEPQGDDDMPVVTLQQALPVLQPGVGTYAVALAMGVLAMLPGGPLVDDRLRTRPEFAERSFDSLVWRWYGSDGPGIYMSRTWTATPVRLFRRLFGRTSDDERLADGVWHLKHMVDGHLEQLVPGLFKALAKLRLRHRGTDAMLAGIPTNNTTQQRRTHNDRGQRRR